MPKTQEEIERLVNRAEECRILAGIVGDKDASKSYLQLADSYEILAEEERRLAAVRAAQSASLVNGAS